MRSCGPRLGVVAPDAAQQAVDEPAHVLLRRVDACYHLQHHGVDDWLTEARLAVLNTA